MSSKVVQLTPVSNHANNSSGNSAGPMLARPRLANWEPALIRRREVPFLVRINRLLRMALIALCGLVILAYGLDVSTSNEVGRMQDQARRLNEQNSELSAQLLKIISFQGIQDNVLGRTGLRAPEEVIIVREIQAPPMLNFEPKKHRLPLMSGY